MRHTEQLDKCIRRSNLTGETGLVESIANHNLAPLRQFAFRPAAHERPHFMAARKQEWNQPPAQYPVGPVMKTWRAVTWRVCGSAGCMGPAHSTSERSRTLPKALSGGGSCVSLEHDAHTARFISFVSVSRNSSFFALVLVHRRPVQIQARGNNYTSVAWNVLKVSRVICHRADA